MSVSILEALQNAEYNFIQRNNVLSRALAKSQLHNAIVLLSKGYHPADQVEALLDGYDQVEDVPEREDL